MPNTHRVHERIGYKVELSFNSEHNFYMGFTENISEGGVFVATFQLQDIGQQIRVALKLFGREFLIGGMVRWVRPFNEMHPDIHPGMGIQFTEIAEDAKQAITQFCDQRSPLFYD